MNKKLIAAAIAAVVAAPAAVAADTTLYGKVNVSIQANDNGTTDNYTVNSNASRIGVKGSEDLGNGLKAIFKMEFGVAVDQNAGINNGRNAYVGLAGDFGTFLAGKHDTPAKVAYYAAGNDHLDGTPADLNNIGFTERRLNNAIAYISPNMSGFTVAAAVVPGEGGATNNDINNAYSIAAIYGGGGLKATVSYEVADKEYLGTTADEKMLQAGASYTFGDFTIGAQYQDVNDKAGTAGRDETIWALSAKAAFGNNYVAVNYADRDDDGVTTDGSRFGIGVGHKFSKRTQVYAAYANQDNGTAADTSAFALGMIHTF
jgi:predicted porin